MTAPQLAWPRTRMTLVPRTAAPYSRLAMISGVAMLPATRATKMCPMLWSKMISTGTRESAQESTAAKGSCLSTVWSRRIFLSWSKLVKRPGDEALVAVEEGLEGFIGREVALGEGGFGKRKPVEAAPTRVAAVPARACRGICGERLQSRASLLRDTSAILLARLGRSNHAPECVHISREKDPARSGHSAAGTHTLSAAAISKSDSGVEMSTRCNPGFFFGVAWKTR